jgi:hypothetical protein
MLIGKKDQAFGKRSLVPDHSPPARFAGSACADATIRGARENLGQLAVGMALSSVHWFLSTKERAVISIMVSPSEWKIRQNL